MGEQCLYAGYCTAAGYREIFPGDGGCASGACAAGRRRVYTGSERREGLLGGQAGLSESQQAGDVERGLSALSGGAGVGDRQAGGRAGLRLRLRIYGPDDAAASAGGQYLHGD